MGRYHYPPQLESGERGQEFMCSFRSSWTARFNSSSVRGLRIAADMPLELHEMGELVRSTADVKHLCVHVLGGRGTEGESGCVFSILSRADGA